MGKEELISKYVKFHGNTISDKEWECDIFSILSDVIEEYASTETYSQERPFFITSHRKQRLSDLLYSDLLELAKYNPEINSIVDKVYFEELFEGFPGASAIANDDTDGKHVLILFSTPLLHVIHVFFTSCELLSHRNKTENCLEKFDSVAMSNEFDDTTLVLKIARELKLRFIDFIADGEPKINFVHAPFDVCEQIRAARRFIVAHEISHILLNHSKESFREIKSRDNDISFPVFNRYQEYQADSLACDILLSRFIDDKGKIKDLAKNEVHDLNNTMLGVRIFFFMMEFVECYREWYKTNVESPRPQIRDAFCTNKFLHMLAVNNNNRLLFLMEGYSLTKAQLMGIFKSTPDFRFGVGISFLLDDAFQKDNKEIFEKYQDDPKMAEFLVLNKDYNEFKRRFTVFNSTLFDSINEFEFQIWLLYYYNQFGPDTTSHKFRMQLGYKKLEESSLGKVFAETDSFSELNGLIFKRKDIDGFYKNVEQHPFKLLMEQYYQQLLEYQNKNKK